MISAATVLLWGTPIGTVSLDEGESIASFEYNRDFPTSGIQPSPLLMPTAGRVYRFPTLPEVSFHGLPGLLADSLPDKFGNAVIDAWLESQGRPRGSMNPVERLCYTGTRGMGALEFVPAIGPEAGQDEALDVARLTELAQSVLTSRSSLHFGKDEQGMAQIVRVGTSAGGARAKALIAWNEATGEVRSGQVAAEEGFGYWLLKFDGIEGNADKEQADGPRYTQIEYAYHLMAVAAGSEMSECRLYEEGSRRHFLTRRFDRMPDGGKLHMQTLGALAHFDFNAPGAHSYEQATEVMRLMGLGQAEIEQLFRRAVFNVAARNQDDHVTNISFLMDRSGAWSLAPAYDVTYAHNPGGAWTGSHQMTLNGKRDGIEREDLMAAARHMSIKTRMAEGIVSEVCEAVCNWPSYAEAADLPEAQMDALRTAFPSL